MSDFFSVFWNFLLICLSKSGLTSPSIRISIKFCVFFIYNMSRVVDFAKRFDLILMWSTQFGNLKKNYFFSLYNTSGSDRISRQSQPPPTCYIWKKRRISWRIRCWHWLIQILIDIYIKSFKKLKKNWTYKIKAFVNF